LSDSGFAAELAKLSPHLELEKSVDKALALLELLSGELYTAQQEHGGKSKESLGMGYVRLARDTAYQLKRDYDGVYAEWRESKPTSPHTTRA
jgi:hypothetical protein